MTSRIMSTAAPGGILESRTVRELVAGSGGPVELCVPDPQAGPQLFDRLSHPTHTFLGGTSAQSGYIEQSISPRPEGQEFTE
jgi:hypothetical protein